MPCALQTSAVLAVSPLVMVSGVSIGKEERGSERGEGEKEKKGKGKKERERVIEG